MKTSEPRTGDDGEMPLMVAPPTRGWGLAIVCLLIVFASAFFGASAWWVAVLGGGAMVVLVFRGSQRAETLYDQHFRHDRAQQQTITDWQRYAKDLQLRSELSHAALLQLKEGIIVVSEHREILLMNPAARELLNVQQRDSFVGRSLVELVRDPGVVRIVKTAMSEHQPQEAIVELKVAETHRPLRVRAVPLRNDQSGELQITLRDESESRRLDDMRREFVANVSHELKTPLAAIKGYAETVQLAAGDDPETAIHFMNQIMSQCHRLEDLIADMMRLARAQAGKEHLNLASVSFNQVVLESVRTYEPVAAAAGLDLNFIGAQIEGKVMADAEAILTIANNLIGNALRYTPRGGRVDVSVVPDQEDWCLLVSDNGVGIAPDDQHRIFDRFYRGTRTREHNSTSTGLGLSIVKNLTQSMGGSVSVQSKPGQGATFTVRLPGVNAVVGT